MMFLVVIGGILSLLGRWLFLALLRLLLLRMMSLLRCLLRDCLLFLISLLGSKQKYCYYQMLLYYYDPILYSFLLFANYLCIDHAQILIVAPRLLLNALLTGGGLLVCLLLMFLE